MILLSHWITIFSILIGFWFWVLNRKQTYDLGFAVCFLLLTYVSAHFLVTVIDIAAGQLRGLISSMGTMTASSLSREASNYDEVSMQQSLLFSDSLKVL